MSEPSSTTGTSKLIIFHLPPFSNEICEYALAFITPGIKRFKTFYVSDELIFVQLRHKTVYNTRIQLKCPATVRLCWSKSDDFS